MLTAAKGRIHNSRAMKIALCQINTTIGDFEGNVRRILESAAVAGSRGAALAVFPELSVTGYPPRDLLLRSEFVESAIRAGRRLAQKAPLPMIVGTVAQNRGSSGKTLHNAAVLFRPGHAAGPVAHKMLIPSYDVFDESRYFEPAARPAVVRVGRRRVGVTICEDVWRDEDPRTRLYARDPVSMLARSGIDVLVNLSASPFELGKPARRWKLLSRIARRLRRPVAQVNLVGGNDDLVFDGNSLVVNASGQIQAHARAFAEDLAVVDLADTGVVRFRSMTQAEEAYEALVMGTREYAKKTGFKTAVLGLSGGIDSSVTACVAAAALGARNVLGVLMPGPYSSKGSIRDSEHLARSLGIRTTTLSITPVVQAFLKALRPVFLGVPQDVTEENLQARVRGTVLMAMSNKFGHLLLTTGNKSELSVGYCTLYGDMCGGLSVISDVPKMLVYAVGRHINRARRVIPEEVFTKAPSAELRPNQTDQDSLPPYPDLDAFVENYVGDMLPPESCRPTRMPLAARRALASQIDRAEYKRRQAAPGLRLTPHAFGAGRRIPIARK